MCVVTVFHFIALYHISVVVIITSVVLIIISMRMIHYIHGIQILCTTVYLRKTYSLKIIL